MFQSILKKVLFMMRHDKPNETIDGYRLMGLFFKDIQRLQKSCGSFSTFIAEIISPGFRISASYRFWSFCVQNIVNNVSIGVNAVVIRDVQDKCIAIEIPARMIQKIRIK